MTTATSTSASVQGGFQWVQTSPIDNLNEAITATDKQLNGVPSLKIPFPGVWELTYHARSGFGTTANQALWIVTSLFKNGTLIAGSEALTGQHGPDAETIQTTTGQTVMHTFVAGDEVTLHGRTLGGNANIISNGHGRTQVVARWVSPT